MVWPIPVRVLLSACFLAVAIPAASADDITIQADPAPVITAMVNGKPASFLLDTTLPDILIIDPLAAQRLGVGPVPMVKVQVVSDDVSIGGRIARPRLVFANRRTARSFAGLFSVPYAQTGGLDGAIGPGVLPYDRVRIVLRDGAPGPNARTFTLPDPEVWKVAAPLATVRGAFTFNLARRETILSRPATTLLGEAALITPAGELTTTAYPLGLSTQTQPVRTAQTIGGFTLGPTLARTNAPLRGSDGVDVIAVVAQGKRRPDYDVTLGRAALSGCSDIVWERAAKRLTVHCDN